LSLFQDVHPQSFSVDILTGLTLFENVFFSYPNLNFSPTDQPMTRKSSKLYMPGTPEMTFLELKNSDYDRKKEKKKDMKNKILF